MKPANRHVAGRGGGWSRLSGRANRHRTRAGRYRQRRLRRSNDARPPGGGGRTISVGSEARHAGNYRGIASAGEYCQRCLGDLELDHSPGSRVECGFDCRAGHGALVRPAEVPAGFARRSHHCGNCPCWHDRRCLLARSAPRIPHGTCPLALAAGSAHRRGLVAMAFAECRWLRNRGGESVLRVLAELEASLVARFNSADDRGEKQFRRHIADSAASSSASPGLILAGVASFVTVFPRHTMRAVRRHDAIETPRQSRFDEQGVDCLGVTSSRNRVPQSCD